VVTAYCLDSSRQLTATRNIDTFTGYYYRKIVRDATLRIANVQKFLVVFMSHMSQLSHCLYICISFSLAVKDAGKRACAKPGGRSLMSVCVWSLILLYH